MKNRILARAKASKVKRSDDNEESIKKRLGVSQDSLSLLLLNGQKMVKQLLKLMLPRILMQFITTPWNNLNLQCD